MVQLPAFKPENFLTFFYKDKKRSKRKYDKMSLMILLDNFKFGFYTEKRQSVAVILL